MEDNNSEDSYDTAADASAQKIPDQETEAAVLALTNLAEKPSHKGVGYAGEANVIESDTSTASMPKLVHHPPKNPLMVDHTYTDYSSITEEDLSFLDLTEEGREGKLSEEEKADQEAKMRKVKMIFGDVGPSRKNSGGVVKPFPERFMEVLDRPDMEHIVSWMPHGRAFIVLNTQQLCDVVLPRFFKQSKFMSFTRQLNLWGFKRISKGPDAGAYYHELFLRGRPRLCMLMKRQKIKGIGIKLSPNPDTEPDFYKISEKFPLPPRNASSKEIKPLPPLRPNNLQKIGQPNSMAGLAQQQPMLMNHPSPDFGVGPFGSINQPGNVDLSLLLRQRQSMEQQVAQQLLSQVQGAGLNTGNMNAIDELKLRLLTAANPLNQQPNPINMHLQQLLAQQMPNQILNNNNALGGNANLNHIMSLTQALERSRSITAQIQARLQRLLEETNQGDRKSVV